MAKEEELRLKVEKSFTRIYKSESSQLNIVEMKKV
jgi:hypothetical protein